jgi:hypothetical protein
VQFLSGSRTYLAPFRGIGKTHEVGGPLAQVLGVQRKRVFSLSDKIVQGARCPLSDSNDASVRIGVGAEPLQTTSNMAEVTETEDCAQLLPSVLLLAIDERLDFALPKERS